MTLDSMRCRMTERGVGRTVRDGEAGLRLDTLLPSERGTIPQAVGPPQRISLQKSTLRRRQATAACGRRDLDTCRENRRACLTSTGPAIYGSALRSDPPTGNSNPDSAGFIQRTRWAEHPTRAAARGDYIAQTVSAAARARATAGQSEAASVPPH